MSAGPETRLFVYGTLAPGESNAHVLAPLAGQWQTATVKGSLVARGWAASLGFPALILAKAGKTNAELVRGRLFSSPELPDFWDQLDLFEGEAYRRVITEVELADGHSIKAYVYEAADKEAIDDDNQLG